MSIDAMRILTSLLTACAFLLAAPSAAQTAWKPERAVEIVVVSAPGASNDKIARLIQRIWQESGKTIVLVTHNVREAVCLE